MASNPPRPEATIDAELAGVTGIREPAVLAQLRELGFTAHTVVLLFLAPLVQVAWSDDGVSARERDAVLQRAARGGVLPGSTAHGTLTAWLDVRPTDAFFSACLDAIRSVARFLPEDQEAAIVHDLLRASRNVARASGGVLGVGAVSAEEKALLRRIAAELADVA
jgi:tellurite resistance protein